jgi:glutathione S-transferase
MREGAEVSAARKLYDLAGADPALRFSPYCWRTKLALAHKGIGVETIPWRFTEKAEIAFSASKTVPVLVDGEKVVADSQAIAEYLEAAYPDAPSLFGGPRAQALTQFIRRWTDGILHVALVNILVPDIFELLHPKDQPYFRESREARLGIGLEALAAARSTHLPAFQAALAPVEFTLRGQDFLGGETPLYADHIVFGALQWGSKTSSTPLLEENAVVAQWMERLLGYYGDRISLV